MVRFGHIFFFFCNSCMRYKMFNRYGNFNYRPVSFTSRGLANGEKANIYLSDFPKIMPAELKKIYGYVI